MSETETICESCGFGGDYHSDEGRCMNPWALAKMRERAIAGNDDEDEDKYSRRYYR